MKANRHAKDEAVTDVLGTILMVGITVVMMGGLSLLVLNIDGPVDITYAELTTRVRPGADPAWGTGDEQVVLKHAGGERIPTSDLRVIMRIDGVEQAIDPLTIDGGDSDGHFSMGEKWTSPALVIQEEANVEFIVISTTANAVISSAAAIARTPGTPVSPTTLDYVTSSAVIKGSEVTFTNAQSATPSTSKLVEATSGGAPSTANFNGASTVGSVATDPDNALADGGGAAVLDANGEVLKVSGFTLPPGVTSVTGVLIHYDQSGGGANGNSKDVATLSYELSPSSWTPTSTTCSIKDAGTCQLNIGDDPGASWTQGAIEGMTITATLSGKQNGVQIDHFYISVTYTSGGSNELLALYDWAGATVGSTHTLELRYRVIGDTFDLAIADGSGGWNDPGFDLTSTSMVTVTHPFTVAEYNGGAPTIKFDDLDSNSIQGTLEIDFARIRVL